MKRVGELLAMALSCDPRLLIADESVAALDALLIGAKLLCGMMIDRMELS